MVCQMGVANIKHRKATVKHGRCVFGAPPQHTLEADMQSKLKHSKGRFRHKRKKKHRGACGHHQQQKTRCHVELLRLTPTKRKGRNPGQQEAGPFRSTYEAALASLSRLNKKALWRATKLVIRAKIAKVVTISTSE